MYRFDWYIEPHMEGKKVNKTKLLNSFYDCSRFLDKSDVRNQCSRKALEVIRSGVYYGYIIDFKDCFFSQQLPSNYCRSRFFSGTKPVVEMDVQYFDKEFKDKNYREAVLKAFPAEIQKGYRDYSKGKLKAETTGDKASWIVLDPDKTERYCLNNSEIPPLIAAIPSIIDLDEAQVLDRKKTMQQLLKILIQKIPFDKNGESLFDMEEIKDLHNGAVNMLKRAIGVDVLTTPTDVEIADMRDKNTSTTQDELMKAERTVFNNLGFSQNLFNSDGNIALNKSILIDEARVRSLIDQFNAVLNRVIERFNKTSHYFAFHLLDTTIDNYKELSKMYKEQAMIGCSKLLPQIALGHSQTSIMATAYFENEILDLNSIMTPPQSSHTTSGKSEGSSDTGGRPTKDASEKSEKTLANEESKG